MHTNELINTLEEILEAKGEVRIHSILPSSKKKPVISLRLSSITANVEGKNMMQLVYQCEQNNMELRITPPAPTMDYTRIQLKDLAKDGGLTLHVELDKQDLLQLKRFLNSL